MDRLRMMECDGNWLLLFLDKGLSSRSVRKYFRLRAKDYQIGSFISSSTLFISFLFFFF